VTRAGYQTRHPCRENAPFWIGPSRFCDRLSQVDRALEPALSPPPATFRKGAPAFLAAAAPLLSVSVSARRSRRIGPDEFLDLILIPASRLRCVLACRVFTTLSLGKEFGMGLPTHRSFPVGPVVVAGFEPAGGITGQHNRARRMRRSTTPGNGPDVLSNSRLFPPPAAALTGAHSLIVLGYPPNSRTRPDTPPGDSLSL